MIQGKLEFKKVELVAKARKPLKTKTVYIHITKSSSQKRLHVTPDLMQVVGFDIGDRMDFLQCGSMFALRKNNDDGVFKFVKYKAKAGVICSTNLCEYIMKHSGKATEFDAWVQDGMVIFKPKDNE